MCYLTCWALWSFEKAKSVIFATSKNDWVTCQESSLTAYAFYVILVTDLFIRNCYHILYNLLQSQQQDYAKEWDAE